MTIPEWFGPLEYYVIIATVNFGLVIYFLTTCVRAKQSLSVKKNIINLKAWWNKRKESKDM